MRLFSERRSDSVSEPMAFQIKSHREQYIVRDDVGFRRKKIPAANASETAKEKSAPPTQIASKLGLAAGVFRSNPFWTR